MDADDVIGAFSEAQAARISGLSEYQLRQWSRDGIVRPAFGVPDRPIPYGRIYSFRDLISLQILNDLRNNKKVPLAHLRDVAETLAHLGDQKWIATTLYVLGKRVVFENPSTKKREEVVSGQRVFDIPLRVVARNTRAKIQELNDRSATQGSAEKHRFVSSNRRVFAGTRVPVEGVKDYLRIGYSAEQIIREFPDLTLADVAFAEKELRQEAA